MRFPVRHRRTYRSCIRPFAALHSCRAARRQVHSFERAQSAGPVSEIPCPGLHGLAGIPRLTPRHADCAVPGTPPGPLIPRKRSVSHISATCRGCAKGSACGGDSERCFRIQQRLSKRRNDAGETVVILVQLASSRVRTLRWLGFWSAKLRQFRYDRP